MKANISGIDLFLLAYAFSNTDVTYMVSSSGTTIAHTTMYKSNFTDEYGNTTFKEILRPSVAHFLYELLPLIDNHNKDRQSLLALEDCWPTKSAWFRLVTTLVGMTVTDLHRWDRNLRSERRPLLETRDDYDDPAFMNVWEFANLIAKGLRTADMRYRTTARYSCPVRGMHNASGLARITDGFGNISRMCGKRSRAYQRTCFMCKLHRGKLNQNSQWWCKFCRMPLCKEVRINEQSCEEMHFKAKDGQSACYGPGVKRSFIVASDREQFRSNEDDGEEEVEVEVEVEEDDNHFDAFDTLNFSFTSDDGNTNPDEETNAAVNDTNEALLDSQSRSSIAANNVAPEHGQQRRQVTRDSIQTRSQSGAKQGGGHTRRKKRG